MQRGKSLRRTRPARSSDNPPSKVSVSSSIDPPPPPPPPPPFPLGSGAGGGTGGGGVGAGGVVLPAAQGVVPAVAGAALLARSGSTLTSAVSMRPRSSVTVSRRVTEEKTGAVSDTDEVLAPVMAGGLFAGETTLQA